MKTKILLLLLMILSAGVFAQSVEINPSSGGAIITSSATDKGILVPRMTAAQKDAIASPTAGLLIYQTDATPGFYYHNSTVWTNLGGSGGTASELQKITESSKTGWRILGRNAANYGDIGIDAIDLSFSNSSSLTKGATGQFSTAMGFGTTASNDLSTAMGVNTTSSGIASVTMGSSTTASGNSSVALGVNSIASGGASTAMGESNIASGSKSFATGNYSEASGNNSSAMGQNTKSKGFSSGARGEGTIAKSFVETAIGAYNDTLKVVNEFSPALDSNRVFTVGTGTNFTGNPVRKTAFVIQQDGNVGINQRRPSEKLDIAGSIKIVDGTQGAGKVLTSDANGKASWQTAAAGGGASELEKITENTKTGWRILGRNAANYGDIGTSAIDLSISTASSSSKGATGTFSLAMGSSTTASGVTATAMGANTIASGNSSTAMGDNSTASGVASTAMGNNNIASGDYSTALGNYTIASSILSTSMGFSTAATAQYATAMGHSTAATGSISTAMGSSTVASGEISTAMGNGSKAKSFSETASGLFNTDYTPNSTTSFNASDRAFGVGIGSNTNNRKDGLIVYKDGTLAFDKLITAPTTTTDRFYVLNNKLNYNGVEVGAGGGGASELQKITEGGNTGWRILGSIAANYGNIGIGAIDLSSSNAPSSTYGATGLISTAMGNKTTASGDYSTAIGFESKASGLYSTAIGLATASGEASIALGTSTTASGKYSTTMGIYSKASGDASTALGNSSQAIGNFSTAMGLETRAIANYSTAMGLFTKASGVVSTAIGSNSIASADVSTTVGNNTKAKSFAELAVGNFNDTLITVNTTAWTGSTDRVFTVGIGSGNADRKTGFVIQQNGRVGIGTNNTPLTKALLEVNGQVNYNIGNYGWHNSSGGGGTGTGANDYSIWASARIACTEFNAFSDARIKNIVGLSSSSNDLNTLAKIKITDYTMKDKIQYGNKTYKKVIAQELKEVYPQAVNMSSNIIPNIYQKATAANGWITLKTDLEKDDVVRIVMANNSREYSVEEVTEGKFKVAAPDGEVFVYGKQVSDFHTVDYEALSTLNISATQALLKRIEELEAKNASLTNQVEEMAALKNDIEAIKASLGIGTKTTVSSK
jgi:hypothetical protein